jgi:hypothetical protein
MARGRLRDRFVFRRLAADARKVELGKNNNNDMELKAKLFGVMGRELGAIHAAAPGAVSRIRPTSRRARSAGCTRRRRPPPRWRRITGSGSGDGGPQAQARAACQKLSVMAGPAEGRVPAIHVFLVDLLMSSRGYAGQARA